MDRARQFTRMMRQQRKAISPIIATLLLILIAIAAGVVVYAYVIGFVGNTTTNPGGSQSVLLVTNFCADSSTNTHCSGNSYYITIQNQGSSPIANSSVLQLYFSDTSGASALSGSTTCTLKAPLAPEQTVNCFGTTWSGILSSAPNAGDTISLKVVAPDGGQTTSSTRVIS
jgi:flagellin-like protein